MEKGKNGEKEKGRKKKEKQTKETKETKKTKERERIVFHLFIRDLREIGGLFFCLTNPNLTIQRSNYGIKDRARPAFLLSGL